MSIKNLTEHYLTKISNHFIKSISERKIRHYRKMLYDQAALTETDANNETDKDTKKMLLHDANDYKKLGDLIAADKLKQALNKIENMDTSAVDEISEIYEELYKEVYGEEEGRW